MATLDAITAVALQMAGDTTALRASVPVGGGDISQAARLRTGRGEYLLKWGGGGMPGFFAAEAHGLALLAGTGAVRVPALLVYHDPTPTTDDRPLTTESNDKLTRRQGDKVTRASEDNTVSPLHPVTVPEESVVGRQSSVVGTGFILLEWLAAPPNADRHAAATELGRALAALHRATAPAYGLDRDNYIGATPQPNGWLASWLAFFRERRLAFQADLARRNGYLEGQRARGLARLLDRLDTWIDDQLVQPALLHGDLWGGNFLVGPSGAPALIDPAVYYGDREADLAFTTLFGGFPDSFYHAYNEVWPLPEGWRERRELYNLYHLLNHMNLFGTGYAAQVDQIVRRYAG
jgi:fructosamine-3-kinase